MAKRYGLARRGLMFWIVVAWGVGLQTTAAETAVGSGQSGYAFQVEVPEPRFLAHPDGSSKVTFEGFGTVERRPGAPDLSSKTFLIAIPKGTTPRVEFDMWGATRRHTVLPSPVPHRRFDPRTADARRAPLESDPVARLNKMRGASIDVYERNPTYYEAGTEGQSWVELGEVGVLRDQPFVPVRVRGARWDGTTGRLEVAAGFNVRVRFEGDAGRARRPVGTLPESGVYENVYRETFLNYDQSLDFRGDSTTGFVDETPQTSRGAGTPRRKLYVRENGPVRLDFALLDPAGFVAHPLDTWRLENQGQPVPLDVNDDGDGFLEPGEWVQFYGQALDMEPDTELNTDFPDTDLDLYEDRDFTDENVYFLTIDAPGQPIMPQEPSAPQFIAPDPPAAVDTTVHLEVDDSFRPLGAADPWYWEPVQSALDPPSATRTETVSLPQLDDTTAPLRVRVRLRGLSEVFGVDPDHQTTVSLRNQSNAVLANDPATFDGRTLYVHDFGWSFPGVGAESSDPVTIEITTQDIGGGNPNDVILDWIEVDYSRTFETSDDRFEFVWPDAEQEFLIDGFSGSPVEVWEITTAGPGGVLQTIRRSGVQTASSGPGTFSARFRVDNDPLLPDGDPRRFVAFADSSVAVPPPTDFPSDAVSDLRANTNQADLIVIAHDDVLDTTPGQPLDLLLSHRASAAGGGLTSKVVRLEDIQDEFNFGLPGPLAIREFLRWVLSTTPGEGWMAPKPAYVMLLGDASYDDKAGTGGGNYVPTHVMYRDVIELGHYASDNLLAAVAGGDQLADYIVGRLPARSLSEANAYLQKILDYETIAPAGSWREHAVTFADRGKAGNNPGEAFQFETVNQTGLDEIGAQPYTSRAVRYWTDFYDAGVMFPEDAMRQEIKDAINGADAFSGAAVSQYTGHGNFVVWSDDAFFDERDTMFLDTDDLTNGLRLPWLIVQNCLTGGFHIPRFNTMGEDWLRRSGGGSVAVFAPSGLAFNFIGIAVTEDVWGTMFGPLKSRDIATPVAVALSDLCAQGSIEQCQHYVLLGDPATRLQLRSTEPATGVVATPGNLQVDLSWTASGTPGASYIVVRNQDLSQPFYIERTPTPIAATQFTDTSVTNGLTYYYHVIAIDGEGFESAWSNFNSDCAVSGPDCVSATPLNPDPPGMPTGLASTDPGIGDRLTFTWDANPEVDLDYYTISWGAGSGNPANVVQVPGPIFVATGLTEGQTYCAVVTATNTSGNTSPGSPEVCDFPAEGPGVRLPDFIADLTVSKSGSDALLEWTEVTTDVYGKPAAIANYEIFRGNAPDYSVAGLTKIADCPAPCGSYTAVGALTNGLTEHYRVRAVGSDSRPGGLGSELPRGVFLDLDRGTQPGEIRLSWPAATADLDGRPVDLLHYAVYASDTPLSKESVVDQAVSPLLLTTATSVEIAPFAQDRFYTVFVVDVRGNMSPD